MGCFETNTHKHPQASTSSHRHLQVPTSTTTYKYQYLQVQVPTSTSTYKYEYLQVQVPTRQEPTSTHKYLYKLFLGLSCCNYGLFWDKTWMTISDWELNWTRSWERSKPSRPKRPRWPSPKQNKSTERTSNQFSPPRRREEHHRRRRQRRICRRKTSRKLKFVLLRKCTSWAFSMEILDWCHNTLPRFLLSNDNLPKIR